MSWTNSLRLLWRHQSNMILICSNDTLYGHTLNNLSPLLTGAVEGLERLKGPSFVMRSWSETEIAVEGLSTGARPREMRPEPKTTTSSSSELEHKMKALTFSSWVVKYGTWLAGCLRLRFYQGWSLLEAVDLYLYVYLKRTRRFLPLTSRLGQKLLAVVCRSHSPEEPAFLENSHQMIETLHIRLCYWW